MGKSRFRLADQRQTYVGLVLRQQTSKILIREDLIPEAKDHRSLTLFQNLLRDDPEAVQNLTCVRSLCLDLSSRASLVSIH